MRNIVTATLLVCLLMGHGLAFAAEHPIRNAAVSEAIRLAHQEGNPPDAQARAAGGRSGGHPVLIGAAVGAGAGAVLGALGTSCSAPAGPADPAPCGTHPWVAGALLGAGLGAGVGTLIGVMFKALKH